MDCIVYRMADGVAVGHVNPTLLATMMGSGSLGEDADPQAVAAYIDREIAKFLIENKADEAAFKESIPTFLASKTGPREMVIRRFVEGRAYGGLSETEARDRIEAKDRPSGTIATAHVDTSELPTHIIGDADARYFRNAVVWDGAAKGRSKVDLPKARVIHMGRIRSARDAELEQESGSKFRQPPEIEALFTAERQTRLQELRDIPQTFGLVAYGTPEAIKAAWPPGLPRL